MESPVAPFRRRFKDTDPATWIVGQLSDGDGGYCVLGRLGSFVYDPPWLGVHISGAARDLNDLFARYLAPHTPVSVNDFRSIDFPQRKPKARIMAALDKIESAYKREQGIEDEKPKKVKPYRRNPLQFWRRRHGLYTYAEVRAHNLVYTE